MRDNAANPRGATPYSRTDERGPARDIVGDSRHLVPIGSERRESREWIHHERRG